MKKSINEKQSEKYFFAKMLCLRIIDNWTLQCNNLQQKTIL